MKILMTTALSLSLFVIANVAFSKSITINEKASLVSIVVRGPGYSGCSPKKLHLVHYFDGEKIIIKKDQRHNILKMKNYEFLKSLLDDATMKKVTKVLYPELNRNPLRATCMAYFIPEATINLDLNNSYTSLNELEIVLEEPSLEVFAVKQYQEL